MKSLLDSGFAEKLPKDLHAFEHAFVVRPGFKYESLKSHCDQITFITDGVTTDLDDLVFQISENLQYFQPENDCLIPVGTTIANLLIGYYLCRKFQDLSLYIGIYNGNPLSGTQKGIDGDYTFYRLYMQNFYSAQLANSGDQENEMK